jgi:hypothetical protein
MQLRKGKDCRNTKKGTKRQVECLSTYPIAHTPDQKAARDDSTWANFCHMDTRARPDGRPYPIPGLSCLLKRANRGWPWPGPKLLFAHETLSIFRSRTARAVYVAPACPGKDTRLRRQWPADCERPNDSDPWER